MAGPVTMSGMMSGIDFNALADQLISLEQQPVIDLQNKQQQDTTKKNMWNDILSAVKNVQTAAKALATPTGLTMATTNSTDSTRITATADNTAATGSYQVTIHSLATSTRISSGFATHLGLGQSVDPTKIIGTDAAHFGNTFTNSSDTGTAYVTINGTQVSIDPEADSLNDIISRINSTVTGVTASYDSGTDTLKLDSASTLTVGASGDTSNFLSLTGLTNSPETTGGSGHQRISTHRLGRVSTGDALDTASFNNAVSGTGSFKINGTTINYDASVDGLNDIVNRINTNVSSVIASYDSQTDRVILASKETGSLGISIADTTGHLMETLGLLNGVGDSQVSVNAGKNAEISIPGFNDDNHIYSTSNTVTNAVPGVSFTLLHADPTNPETINVNRSTTDLQNKMQTFVNSYNAAVQLLYQRYNEKPVKNATTIAQQTQGLLHGDALLGDIRTQLGAIATSIVTGLSTDHNKLSNLGVSISSTDYTTGTLTFDTTKFQSAVNDNFQQAYAILFQDTNNDGSYDKGEGGVMGKLLDKIGTMVDTTTANHGGTVTPLGSVTGRISALDRHYAELSVRMTSVQALLDMRAETLRKQMNAAETAINQLKMSQQGMSSLRTSA